MSEASSVMSEKEPISSEEDQIVSDKDPVIPEENQVKSGKDPVIPEEKRVKSGKDAPISEEDRVMSEEDDDHMERLWEEMVSVHELANSTLYISNCFQEELQRNGGERWGQLETFPNPKYDAERLGMRIDHVSLTN